MNVPTSERAQNLGLKDGEWQLFCAHCDFNGPVNTIIPVKCPNCRAQLHVACCKAGHDERVPDDFHW